METPIYDSTKQSFEQFEKQIDDFYDEVDKKIKQAKEDAENWTEEKAKQLKQYFQQKIDGIKASFDKQQENADKKMAGAKQKVEKIKQLLELLKSPPSIDDIVNWAKAAAELYAMQYEQTFGRAMDIAKTVAYVAQETPVVVGKIAKLPNALSEIDSIPIPK